MKTALLLADMGSGDHMGDWGAGWWILMVVMMLAFWGLVIVGVVWLVRSRGGSPRQSPDQSALEVLDRRLAAGEITPEDYRESRDLLGGEKD